MRTYSKQQGFTRRLTQGFTLVELLIVIAIIALLAAILFPVFASAREMALRSTCQGNLKQIALGMQQYVQDYDGTYPSFYNYCRRSSASDVMFLGWTQMLDPYLKSAQVFQCPTEAQEQNPVAAKVAGGAFGPPYNYYGYSDYFYNSNFCIQYEPYYSGHAVSGPGLCTPEAKLSSPSQTVLLGDSHNSTQYQTSELPDFNASYKVTYTSDGGTTPGGTVVGVAAAVRHSGGANYAFADGHVKWLRYTSLSPGTNGMYPQSYGWSSYPNRMYYNAMPPGKLQAPYVATFAINDY